MHQEFDMHKFDFSDSNWQIEYNWTQIHIDSMNVWGISCQNILKRNLKEQGWYWYHFPDLKIKPYTNVEVLD